MAARSLPTWFLTLMLAVAAMSVAYADSLKLPPNQFWIIVASRQDLDEAISIARRYPDQQPSVVRSANGWFAVVMGPQTVLPGSGRSLLDNLIKNQHIPNDAFLTNGDGLTGVIWKKPDTPVLRNLNFDGVTDATLQDGTIRVALSKSAPDQHGLASPIARGYEKGNIIFEMTFDDQKTERPEALLQTIVLDASSSRPQYVFSYFTQGTHCCTLTKIATEMKDGSWRIVNGETLDGSDGYEYEALDNSGQIYLISGDQAFLYAFESYAGSFMPLRVDKLIGREILDVTNTQAAAHRLRQDLFGMTSTASANDLWNSNGFLAAWVAASALLGEGQNAWTKMLTSYDRNSDFSSEKCTVKLSLDNCPDNKKVKIPFPKALLEFLASRGYISDPSGYPIRNAPTQVESQSSIPPSMSMCVNSLDVVKKLIVQAFLNRKFFDIETYNVVTLQDDTTVEALEDDIGKVTCAVTYDLDLRKLIGKLAENGHMDRARLLNQLAKRDGPTISTRVHFTVKPTANTGSTFIELLR
jgi:serine protease Do